MKSILGCSWPAAGPWNPWHNCQLFGKRRLLRKLRGRQMSRHRLHPDQHRTSYDCWSKWCYRLCTGDTSIGRVYLIWFHVCKNWKAKEISAKTLLRTKPEQQYHYLILLFQQPLVWYLFACKIFVDICVRLAMLLWRAPVQQGNSHCFE